MENPRVEEARKGWLRRGHVSRDRKEVRAVDGALALTRNGRGRL